MPATINPIRKARVKKSLLEGNSIRQALADGGYAPGTQRGRNNGTTNPVVKVCQTEILNDLKVSQITPQWLLDEWRALKILAQKSGDYSTSNAIIQNLAKFVAQIAEKHDFQFSPEEKSEFSRIRSLIHVNITAQSDADKPQNSMQPDILQPVKV